MEAFQIGGYDPYYCYYYKMRLNDYFKHEQKTDIQIVILYDDNYSDKYLRIFNYSLDISCEVYIIGNMFSNTEVDTLTKSIIYKEISLIYRTDFNNIKAHLEDRV